MTPRPDLNSLSKEVRILKLTLKKKWFDMILSGIKKEEYREYKEYWKKRLLVPINTGDTLFQKYDLVEFTNGYGKDKPQITLECKGIDIGNGNCKWGAPLEDVFIIKIGKEISRKNVQPTPTL